MVYASDVYICIANKDTPLPTMIMMMMMMVLVMAIVI